MGGIYNRSICAVLAVLFLSMSMSGCLSLVLGREIMEGVRGEPEIKDEWTPYDLSHSFVIDESGGNPLDQIEAEKSEDIKIDETVSKIIIVFKTSVNYHVGDSDQRYVHVKLLWYGDVPQVGTRALTLRLPVLLCNLSCGQHRIQSHEAPGT